MISFGEPLAVITATVQDTDINSTLSPSSSFLVTIHPSGICQKYSNMTAMVLCPLFSKISIGDAMLRSSSKAHAGMTYACSLPSAELKIWLKSLPRRAFLRKLTKYIFQEKYGDEKLEASDVMREKCVRTCVLETESIG